MQALVRPRSRLHDHRPRLLHRLEAHLGARPPPPQPVATQVGRDLVEPGGKARLLLEPREAPVRLQERLLRDVPRLVLGPQDPVRRPPDAVLPASHQHVEGGRLPRSARLDQLLVAPTHAVRYLF